MHYACQNGKKVDNNFAVSIFDQIEKIFDNIEEEIEKMNENEDRSIKEIVSLHFKTLLNQLNKQKKLDDEKVEIIRAIFNERLKVESVDIACEDLNTVSAIGWNEYIDCDGDELTNLKFGYGQLIEHLLSNIPSESILLNETVTKIEWSNQTLDDQVVRVTTYNKNDEIESVHTGLQCICTIPLGYLKENHDKLFDPILPQPKIKAIENLGFGLVNKVFLVFDQPLFQVKFICQFE